MTVRAMKAGALEFLTKPFSDEVLLAAIRQALERSRIALGREMERRGLKDRYASLTACQTSRWVVNWASARLQ